MDPFKLHRKLLAVKNKKLRKLLSNFIENKLFIYNYSSRTMSCKSPNDYLKLFHMQTLSACIKESYSIAIYKKNNIAALFFHKTYMCGYNFQSNIFLCILFHFGETKNWNILIADVCPIEISFFPIFYFLFIFFFRRTHIFRQKKK